MVKRHRMMVRGSRLKSMDQTKFEARFSDRSKIQYGWIRSSDISFEDIQPFIDRLPPKEIDFITMYYRRGKNQKDIARMFGITQGAVSSRLNRALRRLEFLRDLPKVSDDDIDVHLSSVFDPVEIEIIKFMKQTTCQSKTAQLVNEKFGICNDDKRRMTQVKVRHRFEKCIARLAELKAQSVEFQRFYDLLVCIKKNLYKLHEVKLPHFDRGAYAVYSLNT